MVYLIDYKKELDKWITLSHQEKFNLIEQFCKESYKSEYLSFFEWLRRRWK